LIGNGKKRRFFLIASWYNFKKVWPSTRIERKKPIVITFTYSWMYLVILLKEPQKLQN
jgi:hypothetical protein